MKAIEREGVPEIPEWRNSAHNVENDSEDDENEKSSIDRFFNWDEYFYSHIPESEQKKKNLQILSHLMSLNKWEEKIAKRGVAFFLIVKTWADFVKMTVVKDNIMWFNIPGYSSILKIFFDQMKRRKISEYPDALVDASCSLLGNEKIMYVMIDIIFKKTNLFLPSEVSRTLEIIEKWFQVIGNDGKKFPANFDFNFFYKGIEMVLDHEHSISTPKVIWLLYKAFHIFPLQEQNNLAERIFVKRFGSLFFHWSWNIRTVYYKLYLFQLHHVFGAVTFLKDPNEDGSKFNYPKKKSSKNLRFLQAHAVSQTINSSKSIMSKNHQKRQENIIQKIAKIAKNMEEQINTIVSAAQNDEAMTLSVNSVSVDSRDDSDSDESNASPIPGQELTGNDLMTIIKRDIPETYRPYIKEAVKDYTKEKEEYEAWLNNGEDKEDLPEIVLAVPLDETETPENTNTKDDW